MITSSITPKRVFVQTGPGCWLVTEAEAEVSPAAPVARPGLFQVFIKWFTRRRRHVIQVV